MKKISKFLESVFSITKTMMAMKMLNSSSNNLRKSQLITRSLLFNKYLSMGLVILKKSATKFGMNLKTTSKLQQLLKKLNWKQISKYQSYMCVSWISNRKRLPKTLLLSITKKLEHTFLGGGVGGEFGKKRVLISKKNSFWSFVFRT